MIKKLFVILVIIFSTQTTLAGSATNSQELTFFRTGKQSNVIVVVGGNVDFVSQEGCASGRAALNPAVVNVNYIYAQILVAYTLKKNVHFYGNGCISADSTTYINIEYVYFD